MAAYAIFTRESTRDHAEMDIYSGLAGATLGGRPAKPLAFYGKLQVLEGPEFEGAVVIEFSTAAEARAWYESPEYQAALPHRKAGAVYRAFIVEGV
jgi:uncharacterized protein (DUF1330 family)